MIASPLFQLPRIDSMSDIIWPAQFAPGRTDFFIANETVVAAADVTAAWALLADTAHWTRLNPAITGVETDGSGTQLKLGMRFMFRFAGTPVQAEVTEYVTPSGGQLGRLAWQGRVEQDGETILEAYCAWLVETLGDGRLRVVWHETLNGAPAREMAATRPNPALAMHQAWVDDIAAGARIVDSALA
jgi:hypothetical protein